MKTKITIGTRSSKLAMWQSLHVKEELGRHFGLPLHEINIKEIKTKGDHIIDVALSKIGDKGLFTKEIEDALLKNEIDLAVHSLKDLLTKLPSGLKIGAVLKREPANDVIISKNKIKFKDLQSKAKIGTSSLRRMCQLKALRQDLEYLDLRGNLDTRIRKLEEGQYDAIVLAFAGVKRLGFESKITEHLNPTEILPAVGQGAIAIEMRDNDKDIENIILKLNDNETYLSAVAERAFLETLQGGCQVPIGAYSLVNKSQITLHGMIGSLDGKKIVKDKTTCQLEISECRNIGINLAHKLLQNGGREILEGIVR